MKKQIERQFKTKFSLLNSQESSEDIKWSSSDSSDYENVSYRNRFEISTPNIEFRKRKRKTKVLRNVSNLDISFTDTGRDKNTHMTEEKSPILITKTATKSSISPIFNITSQQLRQNSDKIIQSPILSPVTFKTEGNVQKTSPILYLKKKTQIHSPRVRKKLFVNHNVKLDLSKEINNIINPSTKCISICSKKNINLEAKFSSTTNKEMHNDNGIKNIKQGINTVSDFKINNNIIDNEIKSENLSNKDNAEGNFNIDNSLLKTTPNIELFNKVKSYFNNYFNSETSSQNYISECETTPQNSSKTSEEIDIISVTQQKSNQPKEDNTKHLEINRTGKPKKVKYKKDGLAYRLNTLITKQNANISLWQHERFLASNSNFVIPKSEYTAFRVQNVQFKYGSYLLKAVNVNNDSYVILLNSCNITNIIVKPDVILKLYQPFKIINIDNVNVIVNVSKFECQLLN